MKLEKIRATNMVYVSTGGIKDKSGAETAVSFLEHGINSVELSGGCFVPNQLPQLKKLIGKLNLQVHNYFHLS